MNDAPELASIRQYQLALALGDVEAAERAFTAIYKLCDDDLSHYLEGTGLVQEEMGEIGAGVWEDALAILPTFEDRGIPFSHWLKRTAWHRVQEAYRGRTRDRAKREKLTRQASNPTNAPAEEPLEVLVQAEGQGARQTAIRDALESAMAELSERDRKVVMGRIGDDWRSSDQVAAELGLSRSNVDTIFSRATRRLREALISRYGVEQLSIWAGIRLSETGRRTVRRASGSAEPARSERSAGSGRTRTGQGA